MKLAASPRECARTFSIPHHQIRTAIRDGELVPHARGRRSVILFSDIEAWIRSWPRTKSSLRELNQQTDGVSHVA